MTPAEQQALDAFMSLGTQGRANVLRAWATQGRDTDAGMAAWCLADLVHFGVATSPDVSVVEGMADSADKLRGWAEDLFTAADQELKSRLALGDQGEDYRYETEAAE